VHSAATLLLPLAAEKSKVPFYVAGGLLTAWAIIVSLGLGLRLAAFPSSLGGERAVIALTVVLVAGAISTAVITSSSPRKSGVTSAASTTLGTAAAPATPSTVAEATTATPPAAPAAKKPAGKHHVKASTGTPAPPSSPARAAPTTIALAADPNGLLSFDKKQLSAKAGTTTIAFTNAAALEHNVTIAEGSKVLGATPNFAHAARTLTLTLKAGTYTFYCSVPGHRQGGMEGTLSVT
jgi:plastocyanin